MGFVMSTAPEITWLAGLFTASSTLVYPAGSNGGSPLGYFGPSFTETAVPEPGAWALAGLALIGLAAKFRRARK